MAGTRWSKDDEEVIVRYFLYDCGDPDKGINVNRRLLVNYTGFVIIKNVLRHGKPVYLKYWVDNFTGEANFVGIRMASDNIVKAIASELRSDRSVQDITAKQRQVDNPVFANPSTSIIRILNRELQKVMDSLEDYDDVIDDPDTSLMFDEDAILPSNDEDSLKFELDKIEKSIENDGKYTKTEKKALIKSRIGQGRFRQYLISGLGIDFNKNIPDPNLKIAGHFKPWKDCTNEERLDPNNGYFAVPNVDLLFDKYLASIDEDGSILYIERWILEYLGFDPDTIISDINEKQAKYIAEHRKRFILNKELFAE